MAKKQAKKKINIKEFYKKNQKTINAITIILLIIIPMFLTAYYRSYSANIKVADKWAEDSIINNIRAQIATQVNAQYLHLPAEQKNQIINEQLQQIIKEQKQTIKEQAKQQATLIREELQNDEGQTYLLAIDPYFYLRRIENILEKGTVCDEIIEGECWDNHMNAPVGTKTGSDYHSELGALMVRTARLFGNQGSPMSIIFWMPIIISSLAVIPAFFIIKKKAGNLGGLIGATIIGVHQSFLGRTAGGFSDTDAYNITFPLFIFWLFIEAISTKETKKKIIYSGLAGIITGIYSKFWLGWWYIYDFLLLSIIAFIGYNLIKYFYQKNQDKKTTKAIKELKHAGTELIGLLVGSGITMIIIGGINALYAWLKAPILPIGFTTIKNAAHSNLWPNVFTTVAELNAASLKTIINQITAGKPIFFYLTMIGIIFTIINTKKPSKQDIGIIGGSLIYYLFMISDKALGLNPIIYIILLGLPIGIALLLKIREETETQLTYSIVITIWLLGTIYASTKGIRFLLVMVPAYGLGIGLFAGTIYEYLKETINKIKIKEMYGTTLKGLTAIIIIAMILTTPLKTAHATALNEVPSMNDTWWESLTTIKEQSKPDAIINSWWDFGHWFKYVADRGVTFDGASQNTPNAHWIGKVLSTNNEDYAIGILRMLDCSNYKGFNKIARIIQGDEKEIRPETILKTKPLVDKILSMNNKEKAKEYLEEQGFTEEEINTTLEQTYCEPPEDYFITSQDMVGKSGVWGHFGAWNFTKAYTYTILRNKAPEEAINKLKELGIEEKEAKKLYYDAIAINNEDQANSWISPWPNYLTSRLIRCQNNTKEITCNIGIQIGTQQGARIILEQAKINTSDPRDVKLIIGGYNNNGQRLGGNEIQPEGVVLGTEENLERYEKENPGIPYDVVIIKINGEYNILIAPPELSTGMFTRLFYLNGAYTKHFEKISDKTSPLTGERIIVWKVKWE